MEKTAFSSSPGHWEFTFLPFGLKPAPSCFQHIINSVLVGLVGKRTLVYLDDVIVLGETSDEHIANLET